MNFHNDVLVPDRLPLLVGIAKGQVMALPLWGQGFMAIGGFIATHPQAPPVTIALSLPTRSFAAVFVALGAVRARRKVTTSPINQFEDVWKMTGEVSVRYRLQGVLGEAKAGTVTGRLERDGQRYLVIKDRKNGNTQPPEQLVQELVIQRPGTSNRSRALTISDPWLAQMLEGCEAEQYLFNNRYDCLIIGQDNLLHREAEFELQLPGTPRLSGTVDCVLRVRRWQAEGKVFSSDVLPTSSDPKDVDLQHLQTFPMVIFDGAAAFLRWHHRLRGKHHVVLLSRSDRRLDEAVSAIDQAFKMRVGDHLSLSPPPAGMEILGFRRAR